MLAPARFQSRYQPLRRSQHAGFTLVELMVAMTGGLFLSIVVFALSRDASRFYQRESRIANATLSSVSGFERLSSDIARAGHMATPNIQADPRVCNRPQADWPVMLRNLRGLIVETDTTLSDLTEIGAAGIRPQGIVIAGALNTNEVLFTNAVAEIGGGLWQVTLDLGKPSAKRLGLSSANGAEGKNNTILTSTFLLDGGGGRIVRLREHGMDQYAIAGAVATSPGQASITLAAAPALVRAKSGGVQCGISGNGTGIEISVIDLVRYNLRSMTAEASYAALFKASGLGSGGGPSALPYEGGRAELVRVELDPAGVEVASTREIVSEYAVDLQLTAWRATSATDPTLQQVTTAIDNNYAFTQLIRGLNVRFSVRSREADREGNVSGAAAGDLYRIGLGAGNTAPFARVRTLQSQIPLRNLENANW